MRLAGRKRFTLLEWIVLFGLTELALGLAEYSGLDGKWGDAIVYTVVVFGAVIPCVATCVGAHLFLDGRSCSSFFAHDSALVWPSTSACWPEAFTLDHFDGHRNVRSAVTCEHSLETRNI